MTPTPPLYRTFILPLTRKLTLVFHIRKKEKKYSKNQNTHSHKIHNELQTHTGKYINFDTYTQKSPLQLSSRTHTYTRFKYLVLIDIQSPLTHNGKPPLIKILKRQLYIHCGVVLLLVLYYEVALVSRIDQNTGLFYKRAL